MSGTPAHGVPALRPALRLVPDEAIAAHPLTTTAAPLLPSRGVAGGAADIWEELDRSAAWVQDELSAGRLVLPAAKVPSAEQVRHTLRLLCVAARAAWATVGVPDAPSPIRRGDVPASVPASALARALRRRLTAQTVAARESGQPAADPSDVLRGSLALERVEMALDAKDDGVQSVVDQLTGASAMELLVEVAHDMRSPLGSILFLVERLRGMPRVEAEERQLGLVYGAAFGLSSMVSDVMELARGGDRLAAGEPSTFVVAEVFEAVRAIVAPLAEEKSLVLDVQSPPRDVRRGHGAAIHRVLVNLVTNALKFTPSGSVTLRVETKSRTRLVFVVSDTGRGIPPNVIAQLFQTFRRRASGEDFAFSSAGLGMAICQKLLGAMGGELQVESAENVGTTFRFELELPIAGSDR